MQTRELQRHTSILTAATSLVLLVLWIGVAAFLQFEYGQTRRAAEREVTNLAIAFDEQTYWRLVTVEQLLGVIRSEFEDAAATPQGQPPAPPPEQLLRETLARNPMPADFAVQVSVVDAAGGLVASNLGPVVERSNYTDRQHIKVHFERANVGTYIGPAILGRNSGRWSIPISQRITGADGRLLGVVVVAIDPYYLSNFFQSLHLGAQDTATVLATDGIVRARSSARPDDPGGPSGSMDGSGLIQRTARVPHDVYWGPSQIDQRQRVFAYRTMQRFPLVVVIGRTEQEVLQPWRSVATWTSSAAGLATLVLLGASFWIRREIGRRAQDQAALAEREALLAAVFENAVDPCYVTRLSPDGEHVIELTNAAGATLLNRTVDQVNNHPLRDVLPRSALGAIADDLNRCAASRKPLQVERANLGLGSGRSWQSVYVPLVDASGVVSKIFGTSRDVTADRQREAELAIAKSVAERASQAKAAFLAAMSHELRTPLNAIIGFSNLLLEGAGTEPERRRWLGLQAEAGKTLLTVINDVLDLSKVEAGRLDLEQAACAIAELVDSCADLVRPAAAEKGLLLIAETVPAVPQWVLGDPTRLRQIVLNLLNNALKFTQSGRVSLRAFPVEQNGRPMLRFEVTDTGIGIAADRLAHLFEPFVQADASTTRRFGGTGLGLAICKRLVERMDGFIGAESVEGSGSVFWFEVPLLIAAAPAAPVAVPPTGLVAVSHARLLLAEDLPANQMLMRAVLQRAGYQIVTVDDGAAALAAVQAGGFDLVLMDVQMPVMDGLEATREIRALAGAVSRIPIVALTANAMPEQVAECRQAGMDDHVAKPLDTKVLLATIQRHLRARRDQPMPGRAAPKAPAVRDEPAGLPADIWLAERLAAVAQLPLHDAVVMHNLVEAAGVDVVGGMLGGFREDAAGHVAGMIDAADADALHRSAHNLTSIAGNLGFLRLAQLCRVAMELRGRGEVPSPALRAAIHETSDATIAVLGGIRAG